MLIEAGFDSSAALIANIAPGVIAVVGGFIALCMMDRINRRKTLIIGFTLTTICHFLIGIASMALPVGNPLRPYVILFLVVAFVGSMQTFLNIAVWVMLSEIFPLHMRGFGDRRLGLLPLDRQRLPGAVLPIAGRGGRHHRHLLPVRRVSASWR